VTPEVADEVISSTAQNQNLNDPSNHPLASGFTQTSPEVHSLNNDTKVPAWWLIVAAITGALITGLAMKLS